MDITLEALGLTKKAVEEKVIEVAVERLLSGATYDESGNVEYIDSKLHDKMKALVKERIDETVNIFGEKHILPNVSEYIQNITLEKTNQWGEKQGDGKTFIEYLVQQAENYMTEEVDADGKTKKEHRGGGSYWTGSTTRIVYMIDKHLNYEIKEAMKQALVNANSSISMGIQEAVKMKLAEIQESLSISVISKKKR